MTDLRSRAREIAGKYTLTQEFGPLNALALTKEIITLLADVERETLMRAAKAKCYRCRIGAPFEPPEVELPMLQTFHVAKDNEPAGWCDAVAIRALAQEGGK